MSLAIDGVWEGGIWAPTVWAAGVWREGAYVPDEFPITPGIPAVDCMAGNVFGALTFSTTCTLLYAIQQGWLWMDQCKAESAFTDESVSTDTWTNEAESSDSWDDQDRTPGFDYYCE